MPLGETPLAMARRHVAEAELRIARQKALIAKLVYDKHSGMILQRADTLLALLEDGLRLAREHLRLEHEHYGYPENEA
jgi:hypothetical protein